jgi:hypothetical protein
MSRTARRAEVERILSQDKDMSYVFRKINEMGQPPEPIKVDDRPVPQPIRIDPLPQPSHIKPDPRPIDQTDKILAELQRMWPLLTERDRLELQGIAQLKVFLNSKQKGVA